MKLSARKTLVALSTVTALSLSGVAVPAMAEDGAAENTAESQSSAENSSETSGSENNTDAAENTPDKSTTDNSKRSATPPKKEGSAAYSKLYKDVANDKKVLEADLDAFEKSYNDSKGKIHDSEALTKLESAARFYTNASNQVNYVDMNEETGPAKTGTKDDSDYGILQSYVDALRDARRDLNDAYSALDQARKTEAANKCEEQAEDSESGSSIDSISSKIMKGLGSSGVKEVYKNGKKTCVSRSEYLAEKLTKIVAILGTLFTLVTTVTKISETLQKQAMPKTN